MRSKLTLLLVLIFSRPAFASDGVLEINQTCAVQTGCFAGDAAGFPVTIDGSAGHGYRLSSDLTVPNENTDGIVLSTSDVGIDLNSFAILGPVTCTGIPLSCTPGAGTGSGVRRTVSANRGISVKNGSIAGMGNYGVLLGDQAEVRNLRVRSNRIGGVLANDGSIVSGNTAHTNGGDGITANAGSTISDNSAFGNGGFGISAGSGSTVEGNTAYANGIDGITANLGSTVSTNTAYDNGVDGISASAGSTVQRNTAGSNTGFGLNLGAQSAYRQNTINGNTAGPVTGAGVNLGNNYCSGTGTVSAACP